MCPALLLAAALPLAAQTPVWKEFSIGPAKRPPVHTNDILHGALHANSISLRSLIAIATGVPAARIVGPAWIETESYAVTATLSADSRGLRTRSEPDSSLAAEFRALLSQELARRFHLEHHREVRDRLAYTLRPQPDRQWTLRRSTAERGRIDRSGSFMTNASSRIEARGVVLDAFCTWLQRLLKLPVAPAPSLPDGAWDFRLK